MSSFALILPILLMAVASLLYIGLKLFKRFKFNRRISRFIASARGQNISRTDRIIRNARFHNSKPRKLRRAA
jgi:hypothetical protein